jgi:hypothetical protein
MTSLRSTLPVAVIGAGPIGLAATAHLLARGRRRAGGQRVLLGGGAVHLLRARGQADVLDVLVGGGQARPPGSICDAAGSPSRSLTTREVGRLGDQERSP